MYWYNVFFETDKSGHIYTSKYNIMKNFLPILSPYLMLILPIVMLIGLTLVNIKNASQNEIALEKTFSKSEQIATSKKASSTFVKH